MNGENIKETMIALGVECLEWAKKCEKMESRLQISPYGDDKIDELEQANEVLRQRAEQAEAQCTKYHVALLKIKTWCGEPMHYDGVELQYVLNIAKAALEGKQ